MLDCFLSLKAADMSQQELNLEPVDWKLIV